MIPAGSQGLETASFSHEQIKSSQAKWCGCVGVCKREWAQTGEEKKWPLQKPPKKKSWGAIKVSSFEGYCVMVIMPMCHTIASALAYHAHFYAML